MKKIITTLILFNLLYIGANAQYCGGPLSGPSICDTIVLSKPGFSPRTDSLAPMINGVPSTTVIYFQNYDSVPLLGRMNSLHVDTIDNLPAGLCWAMSDTGNSFGNKQNGCIKLIGTPCAAPGQYKIRVKATINGFYSLDLEAKDLRYYVRVNNAGDVFTPLDTTNYKNVPSHLYGTAATGCTSGINDVVMPAVSSLKVVPNPMYSASVISFFSINSGMMTERLTNIIGSEVYRMDRDVRAGDNKFAIERNNLPAGVYFYSISDGKFVATKRLIISE